MLLSFALFLGAAWAGPGEPFAVVELFASEGCSSCPPADELLRTLTQEARAQGKRIFTLSFEVDYWNNLGWVDPFSKPQFTKRQQQYASVLRASSMYTPQMIVNGTQAFVGSGEQEARGHIEQYLRTLATQTLAIQVQNAEELELSYQISDVKPDTVLNIALVERGLESHPDRGENAGVILKHDNVVRTFKTIPLTQKEGTIRLSKSASIDLTHCSIIGYVQENKTMNILAADSVDLN